jgi:NAD(P)-dependent dehydrogenase (short-subunit alcohol dehydrogenase family)
MKTAILTGAYGAIGKEIAGALASSNFRTILLGRDTYKLEELKRSIEKRTPGGSIDFFEVDLAEKEDIYALAQKIYEPVELLVNNVAAAPHKRLTNKNGIEMQWATNVLSYYWMPRAFEAHMLQASEPRIVNVASYWAGGLNLDDPEFKRRAYNNDTAYRQSKQADRMLTYGFAEEYSGKISVNTCHPGDANSKLSKDLGFGGSETAAHAAKTPVYLAVSPEVSDISGAYFVDCKKSSCQFQSKRQEIARLMKICSSY